MSKLRVVVGGQFGSEAKGACTAYLAREAAKEGGPVAVVRVAGPNAGHTAYDDKGAKWALRQIPVAAVVHPEIQLIIGAGSEIDTPVLVEEIRALEAAGHSIRDRLIVDRQATIITDEHKQAEGALVGEIGSTGKGIGAARADRLMRQATTVDEVADVYEAMGIGLGDTSHVLFHYLQMQESTVLIEGTQGYGLGLHAGHYPKCTSSDCRAIDFLAMAGIDPNWADDYRVWVVMRTYPIRVAGNSGLLKGETTWEELGFEAERTTVTQKVRRVGAWDGDLARAAVIANGGPSVVRISLSMADYVVPAIFGATTADEVDEVSEVELNALVSRVEADAGAQVGMVGTGPQTFLADGEL